MSKGETYVLDHGVPIEVAIASGFTWTDDWLYIPVKDSEGNEIFKKARNLNFPENGLPKYKNPINSKAVLFNLDLAKDSPNIIICEGEIDAVRLSQEGIPAVSSTGGATTFNKEWRSHFEGKEVWVCLDNDEAGFKGTQKILEVLPDAKIIHLPDEINDICDYFNAGYTKQDFMGLVETAVPDSVATVDEIIRSMLTITLKDLYETEYEKESFIIDYFLPVTGMTMISGDSGVGKSWIALEVIRAITTSGMFLDHFKVNKPNIPILLIDKENGLRRIKERSKSIGVPETVNIHIIAHPELFTLENAETLESTSQLIAENGIQVVIVDSFIDLLIGDENNSKDISTVFNILRTISSEVCWLLLHHESKPIPNYKRSSGDRARGSSNIKAQVDYLFSVQRSKQLGTIHVEQGKARDYEMLPKFALELVSSEADGTFGFRYLGDVNDEVSKVDDAAKFLIEFVTENPNTNIKDMEDAGSARGITTASIKRARDMLLEKKILEAMPDPENKRRKLFSIRVAEDD